MLRSGWWKTASTPTRDSLLISQVSTHKHTHTPRCHATVATFPTRVAGSDLLKLTRDDLVQICGPADGIRLFNALKSRWGSAHWQHVTLKRVLTSLCPLFLPVAGQCVPGWQCTSVKSPLRRAPCWRDTATIKTGNTASHLVYTVITLLWTT